MLTVREATLEDLHAVGILFDGYRQFYDLPGNVQAATDYIADRLKRHDSVVLVAADDQHGLVGFCQLYPSWCSLAGAPIYVLYDLYVDPATRGTGAGKTLMAAALERARRDGRVRMELQTARSNEVARALYESLGWQRDDTFLTYTLAVR